MGITFNSMFADHIAQQAGAFEPQRVNNALLYLNVPATITGQNMGGAIVSSVNNVLVLSLDSFPFPKQDNNVQSTKYLNETRKFAGAAGVSGIDVVYKDFCDMATASILWAWRQAVYDPYSGRIGLARNYKSTADVYLASPDGMSFVRSYYCVGVWPSALDHGAANMDADDIQKITVSFAVDKCYPIQVETSASASGGIGSYQYGLVGPNGPGKDIAGGPLDNASPAI